MRESSSFHNVMLFLVFVGISAMFWLILALNDSAQDNFAVRIHVSNVPDSVTFISDMPEKFHVGVRDKGTSLWRSAVMKKPTVNINFNEYASGGVLRYSRNDFLSAVKSIFGNSSQITSISIDSLRLYYTDNKGKRVPVEIRSKIYPSLGSTLEGHIKVTPSSVLVYGSRDVLDTIYKAVTEVVELKDISETTTIDVNLEKIKNARIIPSTVQVRVPIEPLVKKHALVTLTAVNVPEGENLLLFPSKVPVEYYVAMSRLEDDDDASIELQVDYQDIRKSSGGKLHVEVMKYPERLLNLSLKSDSVEYAIVRN